MKAKVLKQATNMQKLLLINTADRSLHKDDKKLTLDQTAQKHKQNHREPGARHKDVDQGLSYNSPS